MGESNETKWPPWDTETAWTPGPRTVVEWRDEYGLVCQVRGLYDCTNIVTIFRPSSEAEDMAEAEARARADAYLDAAAPEMLEALRLAINPHADPATKRRAIEAAIAKAERDPNSNAVS